MSKKLFLLQKEILIFNRISTSHVKINPSLIPKYISKSIKIPKEKKILPYKNPVPNWAKTPEFSFFFILPVLFSLGTSRTCSVVSDQ